MLPLILQLDKKVYFDNFNEFSKLADKIEFEIRNLLYILATLAQIFAKVGSVCFHISWMNFFLMKLRTQL